MFSCPGIASPRRVGARRGITSGVGSAGAGVLSGGRRGAGGYSGAHVARIPRRPAPGRRGAGYR